MVETNKLATLTVDAAFTVHTRLGPGLLESVYEATLDHEIKKRGLRVERQKSIPISYDGLEFIEGFRADLIVNDALIIELKSIEKIAPVHKK